MAEVGWGILDHSPIVCSWQWRRPKSFIDLTLGAAAARRVLVLVKTVSNNPACVARWFPVGPGRI